MRRESAWPYVGYFVDSSLAEREPEDMPNASLVRLVGWQCGFEPMFVAVWSMFEGVKLDNDEAVELATDLLLEKEWFAVFMNDEPPEPDYIL